MMRVLRISFDVTEDRAGSVMADLADKVDNLSFGLVAQVPHDKNRPRSGSGDVAAVTKGQAALLKAMGGAKKPLSVARIVALWSGQGYSGGSVHHVLKRLVDKKMLRRVGAYRSKNVRYEVAP